MKKANEIAIENIKRLISEKGLNQRKLAEMAKIDAISLNRIMKGKRGIGPKMAEKLAIALGCEIKDLYGAPIQRQRTTDLDNSNDKNKYLFDLVRLLPAMNEKELRALLASANALLSLRSKSSQEAG